MRAAVAIVWTLSLVLLASPLLPVARAPEASGPQAQIVAAALQGPVDLAFSPDGRLHYAELASGHVRAVAVGARPSEPIFTFASSPGGNGGFTGLAFDPDEDGVFYAFYSMEKAGAVNGKINRVSRVAGGVETVLVDDIPWAELHEGGRVGVGPDGYLYVTVGDNDLMAPSQDPASILGKILRLHRDGRPAADNPAGWNPYAFALGFRNPFGLAFDANGTVYVSDNGGEEEVNRVVPGGNHGYPMCTGPCDHPGTIDPIASWGTTYFGPTGIAIFNGTLYLGDFVAGQIRTVNLTNGEKGIFWKSGGTGLLDVEVGPDACLYASTWDRIWRLPLTEAPCGLPGEDAQPDENPDLGVGDEPPFEAPTLPPEDPTPEPPGPATPDAGNGGDDGFRIPQSGLFAVAAIAGAACARHFVRRARR